eukprot:s224_g12.t1
MLHHLLGLKKPLVGSTDTSGRFENCRRSDPVTAENCLTILEKVYIRFAADMLHSVVIGASDVNTLQQNLSQKTYELEALKKSYSQAHQHLQSSLIQMQNHLQVSKAEVSTAKTNCERVFLLSLLLPSVGPESPQGVFLTKDVEKDEVILRVPEECLLDAEKALNKDEVLCKAREQVQRWKLEASMAFFVCLRLLRASHRSDLWSSLAATIRTSSAGVGRWSEAFQSMMAKTSLTLGHL